MATQGDELLSIERFNQFHTSEGERSSREKFRQRFKLFDTLHMPTIENDVMIESTGEIEITVKIERSSIMIALLDVRHRNA